MRLARMWACLVVLGALAIPPSRASWGQGLPEVRVPVLASGITSVIQVVAEARHFDRAHGFRFVSSPPYESLDAYYADFLKGQFDVEGGITESYALRFLRGAPIQIVSTLVAMGASLLVRDPSITTVGALRGRTIAAPITSGRYGLLRGLVLKYDGFDLDREAKVISAPNPTASLTFLLAGRADAALSWEPAVSSALLKNPSLRVLLDTRIEYRTRTGRDLYQVVLAAHRDMVRRDPGLVRRIVAAYRDAAEFLESDAPSAASLVSQRLDLPREAVLEGMRSRRVAFVVRPVTDPVVRRAILDELQMLQSLNLLPGGISDAFFAQL
jgi:NitT/TauT family transport system substrate-binding protein